jgi:hypothetical protein
MGGRDVTRVRRLAWGCRASLKEAAMSPVVPPSDVRADVGVEARRLTRWSLYMLPATVVWMGVLGLLMWAAWIKNPNRAGESVALTDYGVVGWVVMILVNVLGIVPAVLGGWFAVRALRLGARRGALVGLVLNVVVVALVTVNWIASVITQM